jgi:hypothetical protein
MLESESLVQGIEIVAVDKKWQFPAITEKHAYEKVKELVPACKNTVYLAFPWATLIDLIDRTKPERGELIEDLRKVAVEVEKYETVITVCQHIGMLKHQKLFNDCGVTHVFWSHACTKITKFSEFNRIAIKPFPLYPTQVIYSETDTLMKKYLFSFVGAKSNQWYLTDSRALILNHLSSCEGALVKGRDKWHYNDLVYNHQIQKNEHSAAKRNEEAAKAAEYLEIMKNTLFSLCPSGTGPNSIRLWESIEMGVIPVILAETYLPPGNIDMWEAAAIFCNEDKESIINLPEKLKKLAQDSAGTAKRRDYVAQLKFLYGKDVFVTDIVATVLELSKTQSNKFINEFYYRALTSTGSLQAKMCKIFCLSLVSKIMTDLDSISVFLDYIPHENLKKITGKVKDPAIVELLYKVVPKRLLK